MHNVQSDLAALWVVTLNVCVCMSVHQGVSSHLSLSPLLPQSVRRVALVAFNSAAHDKPVLIADLLESLLPILYRETKVRVSGAHTHACTHARTHPCSHTHTHAHTHNTHTHSTVLTNLYTRPVTVTQSPASPSPVTVPALVLSLLPSPVQALTSWLSPFTAPSRPR